MPADLVGTRIWQPGDGTFRTELGPVFANLLLADEINRAPAKVQSALLEVMQEHQVTIGGETHRVPEPFLVLATQNPIESEGTYDLPEAQVDRFLFKLVVDYPAVEDEIAVVDRMSVDDAAAPAERSTIERPARAPAGRARGLRRPLDDRLRGALVDATRHPGRYGLADLEPLIQFGASPRASLGLVQAARALALLRGRTHVDRRRTSATSPPTCCATGSCSPTTRSPTACEPDELIDRLLERGRAGAGRAPGGGGVTLVDPPGPPGPRARSRDEARRPARPRDRAPRRPARCPASAGRPASARAPSSRSCARTSRATTRASSTPRPARAPASRTSASTCPSAR